ncbi:hypothetical protein UFOVP1290_252 [uncultured Caudovirales phage]|uniref:Uncharacterized protein n=1 Tax=uncultured Caudovirales phage TaxID=2100421 RepID=A0A6J5RKY2_9CAUD|nr:hypothetical protein UFOVP1290_252 [uncultured Caudovirales phage]
MDKKLTEGEVDQALQSLIDKGLVEKIIIDGVEKFQLTMLGLAARLHEGSNPETRN